MRTNANVHSGQLWRVSDPRRLRLIRVEAVYTEPHDQPADTVYVTVQYPLSQAGAVQMIPFRAFLTTGTKGLVRVS